MISSLVLSAPVLEAKENFRNKSRVFTKTKIKQEPYPIYGGTLVWGSSNPPLKMNPLLTTQSVSIPVIHLIFNRLVRIDGKAMVQPDLAEKWKISNDGLTYTFYLRKGVKFHDGKELTGEDVIFTYKLLIDPDINSPFRSHFKLVKSMELIDPYTVVFHLKRPFPSFLRTLVRGIVPKHVLNREDIYDCEFNYHPIGTGPFKFVNWNRETDQIELQANLDYFEGRPYLDRIVMKSYRDISQLWSALMRGEVDMSLYLNREDYEVVKNDPVFTVHEFQWIMYSAVLYDLKDPIYFDKEVRKAIAYGINKQGILNSIFIGGTLSAGPFHPDLDWFNNDVQPLEFNPTKARMSLMHRGWIDKDGDGVREKGGRELEMRILVDERSDIYKKIATMIRQQLSEVGIKVLIQLYNDDTQLTKEFLDSYKPQAWLRFFVGFGYDKTAGYDIIGNWYSKSNHWGGMRSYKSEKVDQLFDLAKVTQDSKARDSIYKQLHKIIYDDQPACFLFFPISYHVVASKFQNTEEFFNNPMPVYTLKDWYVSSNQIQQIVNRVRSKK